MVCTSAWIITKFFLDLKSSFYHVAVSYVHNFCLFNPYTIFILKKKKNTWRRIKYFYGASDVEICLKKRLSEMG